MLYLFNLSNEHTLRSIRFPPRTFTLKCTLLPLRRHELFVLFLFTIFRDSPICINILFVPRQVISSQQLCSFLSISNMRTYDENASIQRRQCIYSSLSSSSASSSATWGHCVVVGHVREVVASCRRIDRSCCSCHIRSSPLSVKSARVQSQSHADTTSNKIVSLLTSRVLHRCQHLNRSVSFDSHST